MAGLASLFSGVNFKNTIRNYCGQVGWNIADLNDRRAMLKFNMESGRSQTLYIIRYETTLEFSVPSIAQFNSVDEIPHYLSTLLLKRSSERKFGFWCIEEIGGSQVYSHMHNAELQLIDVSYFATVVRGLISECDEFEGVMLRMINS